MMNFAFPFAGSCVTDFYCSKNPLPLAGFEAVNIGSSGKHANH
jgi:hypothetical protein